ncbi:MAG: hypothetical protein SFW35_10335 [Chitinophagales bacterium]|nr:hypothetical protein [Chitinophagales bacterium]
MQKACQWQAFYLFISNIAYSEADFLFINLEAPILAPAISSNIAPASTGIPAGGGGGGGGAPAYNWLAENNASSSTSDNLLKTVRFIFISSF